MNIHCPSCQKKLHEIKCKCGNFELDFVISNPRGKKIRIKRDSTSTESNYTIVDQNIVFNRKTNLLKFTGILLLFILGLVLTIIGSAALSSYLNFGTDSFLLIIVLYFVLVGIFLIKYRYPFMEITTNEPDQVIEQSFTILSSQGRSHWIIQDQIDEGISQLNIRFDGGLIKKKAFEETGIIIDGSIGHGSNQSLYTTRSFIDRGYQVVEISVNSAWMMDIVYPYSASKILGITNQIHFKEITIYLASNDQLALKIAIALVIIEKFWTVSSKSTTTNLLF